MKKRGLVLLGVILFSMFLIGCGKKADEEMSESLESQHFILEANLKESSSGDYKIKLQFTSSAPSCKYVLYENDKEVAKAIKEETGEEKFYFDFKNKKSGTYKYKIKVVDKDNTEIEKKVEVLVKITGEEKPKVNEATPEEGEDVLQGNENEEINPPSTEEPPIEPPTTPEVVDPVVNYWSPYQQQYEKGDIVVYNGKSYICIQAHSSLPDWYPTVAASLWSEY